MATYWENSCSFGLRYVSWYKYLIVSLVFSHLGFWSGNLFLIAPFPDLCLLVPQFTAVLMQEVSRLLSLQHLTTTRYHPMYNGLVERFHATLKQVLRRMCAERPKDWDKYLQALLFAIRKVPQESLGFVPFEQLYGRSVRGPMAILRELWASEINDEQVLSTYQYVIELRKRLEQTCKLARENLEKNASQAKGIL